MAILNFPNTGLYVGLTYTGDNGVTYVYDGVKWVGEALVTQGTTGFTGSRGFLGYTGSRGVGYTGSQGDQGYAGSRGNLGFTGSEGYTGSRGEPGDRGLQGNDGQIGYSGSQGDTGYTGSQGDIGYVGSEGTPGQQGNRGYTGSEGAQGTPGLQGLTGAQGISIVLVGSTTTVTTSTVGFGTAGQGWINTTDGDVYFWNTGTQLWENIGPIVGPQGDLGYTGSQGSQGNIGLTGDTGYTGSTGANGYVGSRGIDGYVGSKGDIGYVGSKGDIGYSGSRGLQGYDGSQGDPGYVGSQGDVGYVGSQGDTGYTGSQGDLGYVGSQGDLGYVGSTGDAGPQGYSGSVGFTGSVGYTGSEGAGYTGSQGDIGYTGSRGAEDRLTTGSYSVILGADGNLTLPNNSLIATDGSNIEVRNVSNFNVEAAGAVNIYTDSEGSSHQWQFGDDGWLSFPGTFPSGAIGYDSGTQTLQLARSLGVSINTQGGNWVFGQDGTLTSPGHIIPDADLTYDLGSTSSQWRSIYVGTGTIYIGGVALGVNQDNYVTVDGNPIITVNTAGNITIQGDNILTPVTVSAFAPDASVTDGNLWFNNLDGRTYVSYNGQWLDASPSVVPTPDTYLDEITVDGSTLNINGGTLTIDDTGTLLVNGSEVSGSGYGATLTASATDPGTSTGTLWFNTIEGRTYLKYNDQWVDVNPTVVPQPSTYLDEITIDGSTINMNGSTLAINTAGVLLVNGSEVTGSGHQLTSSTSAVSLASDGTVTLPEGGTITEGLVTSNPTIQLTPATPDVASQKLVIKGGGYYPNTENGITIVAYSLTWSVGNNVGFEIESVENANQTLYWWVYPGGAGLADPGTGTVSLDGSGIGYINFDLDSDDYEFTVRVSPTNNVYDPESTGAQSLLLNSDAPTYGDHHLHLTTGDLTETSIFLGVDNQNVRTTTSGTMQITTPGNNIWSFGTDGVLTLSTASTILGNSEDPNVYIEVNTSTWTFAVDGSTTFPSSLKVITAASLTGGAQAGTVILQEDEGVLQIVSTGTSTMVIGWGAEIGSPGDIATIDFSSSGAQVITGDLNTTTNAWLFGMDGGLTFPDATIQTTAWTGTVAYSSITGAPAEFNTGTLVAQAVSATTATNAEYAYSFNTGTLVATAVTALNWAGGQITTTSTFIGSGSASSTNTGVLRVQGGAGISGNLYANTIYSGDGYFRGPAGYGQLQLASGGELYLPSNLVISSGGLIKGPGSSTHIGLLSGTGGAVKFYGTATIAATNTATSTTTGALTVAGGVGVGGNLYAGGYVAQAALPAFRVYGAGTTNNLTSTQNTTGVLNGNNYVVDYNQGSHLSTSTGVFTAPVAGLYQINVVARNAGYGAGISQVAVVKNRTVSNAVQVMVEWASTSTMNHAGGSTVAKLAVGDTLELKVYAGEINFDLNDNWSVAFLG